MIVPMKKVTVLCLDIDRERTLEELRELGVIHMRHVQTPSGESVEQARLRAQHVSRALEILPGVDTPASGRPVAEVIDEITGLLDEQKENTVRLDALAIERKRIAPLGHFTPSRIRELAGKGIHVKLCKLGAADKPEWPEGVVVNVVGETKDGRYVAAISQHDFKLPVPEFRLPEISLAEIESGIAKLQARNEAIHARFQDLGGEREAVAEALLKSEDDLTYMQARAGMGASERIAYLQGFIPDESVDALRTVAREHGWGLVLDDPSPEDNVPTSIRSPAWVKPIKAVFDITGILPGYDEVDVSPVFLIALSIFFAMLVGDAGYGAIFLLLTAFARFKMKKAPAYPFAFMGIMSVSTIIWGALTGTYFGIEKTAAIPRIVWLDDTGNVMLLCFIIGAVHLSVAHLWNAWLLRNSPQAAAHIGWVLSTWTMFFVAGMFVLGRPLPGWIIGAFAIGLLLIILFMTPVKKLKEEWFNHAMLPLSVINNFTDVVSYLRLFAVGTASYAVAESFNQMLLGDGWGPLWRAPITALLLFMGHALNIALCGLGILVHGVRLNTLEFSSHMGLQWKGHKYMPFERKAKGTKEAAEATTSA